MVGMVGEEARVVWCVCVFVWLEVRRGAAVVWFYSRVVVVLCKGVLRERERERRRGAQVECMILSLAPTT